MHCCGNFKQKARELFCVLQDGGFEKHPQITAGDKDLDPVFEKICTFATNDVFMFSQQAGMLSKAVYTQEEIGKLINCIDELKESWIDPIYGDSNKLESNMWVQRVIRDANWIFSSAAVRTRLFQLAEI